MTVEELIGKLKEFPPDTLVVEYLDEYDEFHYLQPKEVAIGLISTNEGRLKRWCGKRYTSSECAVVVSIDGGIY